MTFAIHVYNELDVNQAKDRAAACLDSANPLGVLYQLVR